MGLYSKHFTLSYFQVFNTCIRNISLGGMLQNTPPRNTCRLSGTAATTLTRNTINRIEPVDCVESRLACHTTVRKQLRGLGAGPAGHVHRCVKTQHSRSFQGDASAATSKPRRCRRQAGSSTTCLKFTTKYLILSWSNMREPQQVRARSEYREAE